MRISGAISPKSTSTTGITSSFQSHQKILWVNWRIVTDSTVQAEMCIRDRYNNESDAVYLSLLTTDLRTLYDDYYMSIFNVVFWGGIMLCALGLYLYISPILLVAILLVTIPPLVLPRIMNDQLTHARNKFSAQMAEYTGQLKERMGGFELIRAFLREDSYDNQHRVASVSYTQLCNSH